MLFRKLIQKHVNQLFDDGSSQSNIIVPIQRIWEEVNQHNPS